MRFDQAITSLPVADLARSAAFYEGALGLSCVLERGDRRVWQVAPRAFIGAHLDPHATPSGVALTFLVQDIEGCAARLEAAGVAFEREDTHALIVSDPCGARLTLRREDDVRWPVEQTTLPTRANVAACLLAPDGRLLMCERIDTPGIWQLPQGGQDAGESAEQTLWRELEEEVGLVDATTCCTIAYQAAPRHYAFPDWLDTPITRRYEGQDQTVFIVTYRGALDAFVLDGHHTPEFRAYAWMTPEEALAHMAPFKRHILAGALADYAAVSGETSANAP
jgi:putative (di)nucleoside polyphosphate hydrolase